MELNQGKTIFKRIKELKLAYNKSPIPTPSFISNLIDIFADGLQKTNESLLTFYKLLRLDIESTNNRIDTLITASGNTFDGNLENEQWVGDIFNFGEMSTTGIRDLDNINYKVCVLTPDNYWIHVSINDFYYENLLGFHTKDGTILSKGFIRNDLWVLTVGNPIYLDEIHGNITQFITTDIKRCIGYAVSGDTIYFNP